MKTIYLKQTINDKSAIHYEVIEHNGRKFLVYINACNGDMCGFNSYCCLSIMSADGPWAHVVDNKMIGIRFKKDDIIYGRMSETDKKIRLAEIATQFRDYIHKIY